MISLFLTLLVITSVFSFPSSPSNSGTGLTQYGSNQDSAKLFSGGTNYGGNSIFQTNQQPISSSYYYYNPNTYIPSYGTHSVIPVLNPIWGIVTRPKKKTVSPTQLFLHLYLVNRLLDAMKRDDAVEVEVDEIEDVSEAGGIQEGELPEPDGESGIDSDELDGERSTEDIDSDGLDDGTGTEDTSVNSDEFDGGRGIETDSIEDSDELNEAVILTPDGVSGIANDDLINDVDTTSEELDDSTRGVDAGLDSEGVDNVNDVDDDVNRVDGGLSSEGAGDLNDDDVSEMGGGLASNGVTNLSSDDDSVSTVDREGMGDDLAMGGTGGELNENSSEEDDEGLVVDSLAGARNDGSAENEDDDSDGGVFSSNTNLLPGTQTGGGGINAMGIIRTGGGSSSEEDDNESSSRGSFSRFGLIPTNPRIPQWYNDSPRCAYQYYSKLLCRSTGGWQGTPGMTQWCNWNCPQGQCSRQMCYCECTDGQSYDMALFRMFSFGGGRGDVDDGFGKYGFFQMMSDD